jgi:hypothetical protein
MKTQKFLYYTLLISLTVSFACLFAYCMQEARGGHPSPLAGLLMVSSLATAVLLIVPTVWFIPGAGMFDGPDECYEWTDYLMYPFWFFVSVVMWVVTNLVNLLGAIVLYSGGVTFNLAMAYWSGNLNNEPRNIFLIIAGSIIATIIVALLAWWGTRLGIRDRKSFTQTTQELVNKPAS